MRLIHFTDRRDQVYYFRIQIAVITSLIVFILLFRFWPNFEQSDQDLSERFSDEELINQDFVIAQQEVTVQRNAPPVPRPDVTVPDDEVVDVEYDLDLNGMDDGDLAPFAEDPGPAEIVGQPDQPPGVRRIVEPVTPSAARRDGLRVEVIVSYVVSETGEVEEAEIEDLRMFNEETGRYESVRETGYGFREITLRAARQWRFNPAMYQGEPVRSRTSHRFTFGS